MSAVPAGLSWREHAVRIAPWRGRLISLQFLLNPIRTVEHCYQAYGPAIAFAGTRAKYPVQGLFLMGAEYNREILTNTEWLRPSGIWSVRGPDGSAQRAMKFGYGTAVGSRHAALKTTLTAHLTRPRITGHFEALRDIVTRGIEGWPTNTPLDLYAWARRVGQEAAFRLLFGDQDSARACAFGELLAAYNHANWGLWAHIPVNLPGTPRRRLLRQAEQLREFVAGWVEERRGCPTGSDLRAAFAAHRTTTGQPLGEDELSAHLSFISFAAYETMASALTWAAFLLMLHPAVAADLVDELDAAPPVDRISQEELGTLPLLNGVVRETLRLLSPTPVLPWRTIRDWSVGGITLPRGARIVLSPHITHRNPEVYSAPREFRPGRWSRLKPSPYEYLPFSAGPRGCPGYSFATEFIRLGVAAFASRYRVEPARGARFDYLYHGILMPRPGIPVRLVRGDGRFPRVAVQGNLHQLVALG